MRCRFGKTRTDGSSGGNVQGEKTQTAESAAEASAAEEETGKSLRRRKAQERNWKRKMRERERGGK